MSGYAIFCFFILYAIPITFFIVMYTKIVWTLRQRRRLLDEMQQQSRILDIADHQLTRTGLVVAIVFFISLSWDAWFYLLAYAGLANYEMNSILQIVGVFLAALNSCANPFIYSASLPIFRKSIKKTFRCGNLKDGGESGCTENQKWEVSRVKQTKT